MDVLGALAVALPAGALFAIAGPMNARVPVIDQRVDIPVGYRHDAAAATTVAAVRAASRHVLLPAKAHCAVAALSGMNVDLRFIDEFHSGRAASRAASQN
jgi:hypothetical protein